MMFDSIKNEQLNPFMITWDLGRRCNFDCSYCPVHRHDNTSKHATLEELKSSINFIQNYIEIISKHRNDNTYYISLTGGEPTVNPNFIQFVEYIEEWKSNFSDNIKLNLDLTTNGAMSKKIADEIIKHFDHVTISYHAEADESIKSMVFDRILQFRQNNMKMKVNVMMHANQFNECVELCDKLKENDVKFIPRPIGEDPDSLLNTAHKYTDEQKQWFSNFFDTTMTGTTRPCCGGRSFTLCSKDSEVTTKVINFRNFTKWHCSVNLFFLHIEQQTGFVYHHQTCQATYQNTRGSIGSLTNTQEILDNLQDRLKTPEEPIICPNKLCGCGLCIPKSKSKEDYSKIIENILRK